MADVGTELSPVHSLPSLRQSQWVAETRAALKKKGATA